MTGQSCLGHRNAAARAGQLDPPSVARLSSTRLVTLVVLPMMISSSRTRLTTKQTARMSVWLAVHAPLPRTAAAAAVVAPGVVTGERMRALVLVRREMWTWPTRRSRRRASMCVPLRRSHQFSRISSLTAYVCVCVFACVCVCILSVCLRVSAQYWRPGVDKLEAGEQLEIINEAYVMFHSLRTEWPTLSFDVWPDDLGVHRTKVRTCCAPARARARARTLAAARGWYWRIHVCMSWQFPMKMTIVGGSQAERDEDNKITVMHATELHKTQRDSGAGGGGGRAHAGVVC